MLTLATITVAVFALGYGSAWIRIRQLGDQALPVSTKVIMGVVGLLSFGLAAILLASSGLAVIFGEFLVLCGGQVLGYMLSGKNKKV